MVYELVFILDRSTSMKPVQSGMIAGFNRLLSKLRLSKDTIKISLIVFNHQVIVIQNGVDVKDCVELNQARYYPGGKTALLDAIGVSYKTVDDRIKSSKVKPDKVLFVVWSDGKGGTSDTLYNKTKIQALYNKRNSRYKFLFISADVDDSQLLEMFGSTRSIKKVKISKQNIIDSFEAVFDKLEIQLVENLEGDD